MFIKTGNSMFGNIGLIISLLILVVLLYFSYNKCYTENFAISDSNYNGIDDVTNLNLCPSPSNVRVSINGGTVSLNFTIATNENTYTPIKFNIILAQYDINKKNTGNNRVFVSNEYELNSSVSVNSLDYQTNICNIIDGVPICQYNYTNLDIRDPQGNLYYYKIGVSAVYDLSYTPTTTAAATTTTAAATTSTAAATTSTAAATTSTAAATTSTAAATTSTAGNVAPFTDIPNFIDTPYVTPYNITSPDGLFTINVSAEAQSQQLSDFQKYQQSLTSSTGGSTSSGSNNYNNMIATPDGQYELIKSQLGNYPDNLLLDSQTVNPESLADLVDQSMALGIINANITANTTPAGFSSPNMYSSF